MATISSKLPDDSEILIEVDNDKFGMIPTAGAADKAIKMVEQAFQNSVQTMITIGKHLAQVQEKFGKNIPDEFEVTFGIKFSADGNIWIAKASGEAQLNAKLTWKNKK